MPSNHFTEENSWFFFSIRARKAFVVNSSLAKGWKNV